MSILDKFTILSDDEIDPEIDDEDDHDDFDETEAQKKRKAESKFSIEFDTGDLYPGYALSKLNKPYGFAKAMTSSAPKFAQEDNIKEMGNMEERVARSVKKKKAAASSKKQQQLDDPADSNQDSQDNLEEIEFAPKRGMNTQEEQNYFDVVVGSNTDDNNNGLIFAQLGLSRPLLRAVEAMGYVSPTPIQEKVIPFALAGRDICASAATGSGKTAAFALPFLERLLYRPRDVHAIRVLVITPTRELALQIFNVTTQLAQHTDTSLCLVTGGKQDSRTQEAQLRQGPDVVICTPGRMVDHLRNGRGVNLDLLDILILDEADRLLEMGFTEELEELLRHCPMAQRQSLLFSATMSPKVDDLARLSLRKPVRIKTETSSSQHGSNSSSTLNEDGTPSTAQQGNGEDVVKIPPRLIQEFVKIRSTSASNSDADNQYKEALLASLLCRSPGLEEKSIVFCELKKTAKRLTALLHLLRTTSTSDDSNAESGVVDSGIVELHGDLTQEERLEALQAFRSGIARTLIATDVAARGLDIPGVRLVINAELPKHLETYIHRVGRTARAGAGGRAVTLVSDDRRAILRELLRREASARAAGDKDPNQGKILSRSIPSTVVQHFIGRIDTLEPQIAQVLGNVKATRKLKDLERKTERAVNMLQFADEIKTRPVRTWFKSANNNAGQEASQQPATSPAETAQGAKVSRKERRSTASSEEKEEKAPVHPATALRQQAEQSAAAGDYRDFDADGKKKKNTTQNDHRLTRKKRRRLEAIKASEEADREAENDRPKESVKSVAKKAKDQVQQKEMGRREKTAGELAMKTMTLLVNDNDFDSFEDDGNGSRKKAKKAQTKEKIVRHVRPVGGLDNFLNEGNEWGANSSAAKKKRQREDKEMEFTDFDPNKRLKKGGKAGKASFKSKKRFKRR